MPNHKLYLRISEQSITDHRSFGSLSTLDVLLAVCNAGLERLRELDPVFEIESEIVPLNERAGRDYEHIGFVTINDGYSPWLWNIASDVNSAMQSELARLVRKPVNRINGRQRVFAVS